MVGGALLRHKYLSVRDNRVISPGCLQAGQLDRAVPAIRSGRGPDDRPVERNENVINGRATKFRGTGRILVGGRSLAGGPRDAIRGRVWLQRWHRPAAEAALDAASGNTTNGQAADASRPRAGGSGQPHGLPVWDSGG